MSKKKPVVRGPQKTLPYVMVRRTLKPGQKRKHVKDGNPFFAFRVPANLLRAYKALAKKGDLAPSEMLRKHMSRSTGVALESHDE